MELGDLFVSHKQVDPVVFDRRELSLPQPIYLNLDRAKKATEDIKDDSSDISSWKVSNDKPSTTFSWKVKYQESPSNIGIKSQKSSERWTSPYSDRNTWIADMTTAYKKIGLNDNTIKNLIAKNAFESSWGKSAQGDFNFGNLTAGENWKGKIVQGKDKDKYGNPITQRFRAYDSLDGYVADEINFLIKLYDFNQNDDFDTFINKLQGNNKEKRRYAEDPQYVSKVREVYNSI